ncbi:MAG: M20/M25/M40 family metallo-hydrolase [Clostridia bacterium]|nr:M20/M25/M40 family metallo-hydrolase [Clostridia bacterium]
MRKVLIALFAFVFVMINAFIPAFAVEDCSPYEIMKEFVTLYPHRESGTSGESDAGEYISNFFDNCGYTVHRQEFEYDISGGYYSSAKIKDQNYVATLNSDSTKTVVIGAHYDNVFSSGEGQGAYDNGSGVGIMLALAEKMKDKKLPFRVEFVAFGGEEKGLFGSKKYLDELSTSQRANILLYVNLDSILAGDKVYMYCDEVPTLHEDYFVQVSRDIGATVETYPEYKEVAGVYSEGDKLPYTHAGLQSDNATFFNAGIMSVSFSSYSLEKDEFEQFNESTLHGNIMHTENDNLEVIELLYGDGAKQKMQDVYNLVYTAVLRDDFVEQMTFAKQNNPDYDKVVNGKLGAIVSLLVIAVLVIAIIILCGVINKKNQKDILEKLKKIEKPEVFGDF